MRHSTFAPPTAKDIAEAQRNIRGKAIRTPLIRLRRRRNGGDDYDAPEIYLKLENLQPLSSFKVRPSANAIACILSSGGASLAELRAVGVSTASAGNFAQGLAWCCADMGIKCTVASPDNAPQVKIDSMRRLGAEVIKVPYSEWWEMIETHTCPLAPDAFFIHPGAESAVLSGNATIAAEILEDLHDADCIVAPYGSGALVTGIACGVRAMTEGNAGNRRRCRVLAAEPSTACPFALSKKAGRACRALDWKPSFVDGCGGKAVLPEVWELAREVVDGGLAVPLPEIASAIKMLAEDNRIIAEGAGAIAVAAALNGMCGNAKKIVCVVSGGGLDTASLVHILQGKGAPPPSLDSDDKAEIAQAFARDMKHVAIGACVGAAAAAAAAVAVSMMISSSAARPTSKNAV